MSYQCIHCLNHGVNLELMVRGRMVTVDGTILAPVTGSQALHFVVDLSYLRQAIGPRTAATFELPDEYNIHQ